MFSSLRQTLFKVKKCDLIWSRLSSSSSTGTAISDYRFFLPIQTRANDNDAYSHVNNTIYNLYVDTIINNYINWYGFPNQKETNCKRLVAHASFDYKSSAVYPEILLGALRVDRIGRSSVQYGSAVFTPKKQYLTFLGDDSQDPLMEIGIGVQGLITNSDDSDVIMKLMMHYNPNPCLLSKYIHVFVDGADGKPVQKLPTNIQTGMEKISL
uniref:uncharacterized protein LOC120326705 n=1 Tax=Styela clava TaxID=7725 RepID=UPI00193952D2|nr:uncharacterized protein LOC120326705 [Styela clava]